MEPDIRLGELVAVLSVASDLGRGQPLEHGLGVAVPAVRPGEECGLDEDEQLFTPDCEIEFPGVAVRGMDEWRAFQRTWLGAFPDGAYEVVRNEPAGDAVFVGGL
ncbi:MAG TPA: nuclear transport factor 2 family protein [Solirubrobacteraceae bacterium]|nr:nuclear transport factor 2 family protein [Solirubrobacteraceae bacterium]